MPLLKCIRLHNECALSFRLLTEVEGKGQPSSNANKILA